MLNSEFPRDPIITLLGICPRKRKTHSHKNSHINVTAPLLTIGKK